MKQKATILVLSLLIAIKTDFVSGLLCYRCDSTVEKDCLYYPAPLSTFEECENRTKGSHKAYRTVLSVREDEEQMPIYIRYKYKLCPYLERTIKQLVPITPNPMENVNYACGKAITHGPDGVRIRRGCTPDLFLNGTNACVSVQSSGDNNVACFCTQDFCNDSDSLLGVKHATLPLLILCFSLLQVINKLSNF